MYGERLFSGAVTDASRGGNIDLGRCSDKFHPSDSATGSSTLINLILAAGCPGSVIVPKPEKSVTYD